MKRAKSTCEYCGRSRGVQFVIFNPRFKPFGTCCCECEAAIPEGMTLTEAIQEALARNPNPSTFRTEAELFEAGLDLLKRTAAL